MSFYNKFASIAIGGPNVNTVPTPYGVASLDVCGNCVFRNDVNVVGTLTYAGATIAYDNLDISGNLTIGANADISGNLTIRSNADISGNLTIRSNADISGNLRLDGSANLNILSTSSLATLNSLRVLNDSSLNSLDVSNNTTLNTLTTSGQATLNSLRVLNDSSLNNLDVSNNTTLNTLTTTGQATLNRLRVLNDTSLNSLDVSNNTTLNTLSTSGLATLSRLNVINDASLNTLTASSAQIRGAFDLSGNATIDGNIKLNEIIDGSANALQIGYNINTPTFTMLSTGASSSVVSGTYITPMSVVVPANNPDNFCYVKIPIDLFGGRNANSSSSTWTLTYTGVTLRIYKNGILQPSTYQSIDPIGFSVGTTQQATVIGSTGAEIRAYFGYFDIRFPIEQYATSSNTYNVEIAVTGTFTSSVYTTNMYFSYGSTSGIMGYSFWSRTFTQTRASSSISSITWLTTQPTYTAPTATYSYSDALITSSRNLKLLSNIDTEIKTTGSFLIDASSGYITFNGGNNYYYDSRASNYTINYKLQGNQKLELGINSTTIGIDSLNTPLQIVSGTGDLSISGNNTIINSTTGTVINTGTTFDLNATTSIDLTAGSTIVLSSGAATSISSGTNNNLTLTTTGTGTIILNGNSVVPTNGTFNLIPAGTILTTVTSSVPTGYLYCDGTAVSRTTYSRLFTAIGTTFGAGNGTTTFNVPNFLGAFLRGASSQVVGGITYAAAAVGTAQQDATLEARNQGWWGVDNGGGGTNRQVRARNKVGGDPQDTYSAGSSTTNFLREATEVRPFNYAVYYYIKY
jgi:microcystin-dependent protein/cytoskeletal protein CcmA (bactofilin family)